MKKEEYQLQFQENSKFGITNTQTFGGFVPENKHGIDDPVKDLNIDSQTGFGNAEFDSSQVVDSQTYVLQNESGIVTLQDQLFTNTRFPFANSDGILTDSSSYTTATMYRQGGTDVALADGGTGASLADPNADRIFFWDDSASSTAFLATGNSLVITTTTIDTVQDIRTSANPQFATIELGAASDTTLSRVSAGVLAVEGITIPSISSTNTLTNKRITPRVVSMTDATYFTPTGDTADINTQANTQAIGNLTANAPTGTPTDGQLLELVIKSTNVQTFIWNGIYAGCTTTALPTTTTGGTKTDKFFFQYNGLSTKWEIYNAQYNYT